MSKQLLLKIVTPEKLILEEPVDQVTLPTTEGELTILPEHISMIAGLASGDVVGFSNGEHIPVAVSGGFIEVKQVNGPYVSILPSEIEGLPERAIYTGNIVYHRKIQQT